MKKLGNSFNIGLNMIKRLGKKSTSFFIPYHEFSDSDKSSPFLIFAASRKPML